MIADNVISYGPLVSTLYTDFIIDLRRRRTGIKLGFSDQYFCAVLLGRWVGKGWVISGSWRGMLRSVNDGVLVKDVRVRGVRAYWSM